MRRVGGADLRGNQGRQDTARAQQQFENARDRRGDQRCPRGDPLPRGVDLIDHRADVPVREHHRLRRAGAAGGICDQQRIVVRRGLPKWFRRKRFAAPARQCGPAPEPPAADRDRHAHPAEVGAEQHPHRLRLRHSHERLGIGGPQAAQHLAQAHARIDDHRHRTDLEQAVQHGIQLGTGRHQHDGPGTARHARGGEALRDRGGPVVQFRVEQPSILRQPAGPGAGGINHGLPFRMCRNDFPESVQCAPVDRGAHGAARCRAREWRIHISAQRTREIIAECEKDTERLPQRGSARYRSRRSNRLPHRRLRVSHATVTSFEIPPISPYRAAARGYPAVTAHLIFCSTWTGKSPVTSWIRAPAPRSAVGRSW